MIDLGLSRISRLLQQTPQTWRAIHVAGTNGKGSICTYLSALLHASGVSCARFTSPHLIDRWDCIAVDEEPVSEALFRDAESLVLARDREGGIGATQFELLTATAFEIFQRRGVDYGVVEVGMGGRLDATNALKHKVATVISKVGLDHQSFLGDTIEAIALHKAGIMRRGVPCVVDDSNSPSVLRAIEEHARDVGAEVLYSSASSGLLEDLSTLGFEPHQAQNLACAYAAFRLARPDQDASLARTIPIIKQIVWPGRLQHINISPITGSQQQTVLLDGAHNPQSAEVLAAYVDKHLRSQGSRHVTWVLAATEGKDLDGILRLLLRPGDRAAAVAFGPVDGMPWVKAANPKAIIEVASACGIHDELLYDGGTDVEDVLAWASRAAKDGPVVIAGSLYLVSDVLRLLWSREPSGQNRLDSTE